MLNAPKNHEDLTIKILNGPGDEFKDLSSAIRASDSTISFEKLHELLINFEAFLKQEAEKNQKLLITSNYATKPSFNIPSNHFARFNRPYTKNSHSYSNMHAEGQSQNHYSSNNNNFN